MTITSARYHNGPTGQSNFVIEATIDGKVVWVPIEAGNRHYAEIMRQVAAGELTIADAD
jgi:hypothetical protein